MVGVIQTKITERIASCGHYEQDSNIDNEQYHTGGIAKLFKQTSCYEIKKRRGLNLLQFHELKLFYQALDELFLFSLLRWLESHDTLDGSLPKEVENCCRKYSLFQTRCC
jgi:hypothetical protein